MVKNLQKKVQSKKAQAALEFLTTYGWAFLVILIMIAALSYFGVFDPSRFLPDKCIFGTGIGVCQDFTVLSNGNLVFTIFNNLGSPVVINTNGTIQVNGLATQCNTPVMNVSFGGYGGNTNVTQTPTLVGVWNSSLPLFVNISGCTVAVGEHATARIVISVLPVGKSYSRVIEGDFNVKRNS